MTGKLRLLWIHWAHLYSCVMMLVPHCSHFIVVRTFFHQSSLYKMIYCDVQDNNSLVRLNNHKLEKKKKKNFSKCQMFFTELIFLWCSTKSTYRRGAEKLKAEMFSSQSAGNHSGGRRDASTIWSNVVSQKLHVHTDLCLCNVYISTWNKKNKGFTEDGSCQDTLNLSKEVSCLNERRRKIN